MSNSPLFGPPVSAGGNGQQVTSAALTNGKITAVAGGTATWFAVTDRINGRLLATIPLPTPAAVGAGQSFSFQVTITIPAKAPLVFALTATSLSVSSPAFTSSLLNNRRVLSAALLTTSSPAFSTPGSSINLNAIIMSPTGNDANAGTLAAPVASFARAQVLVRASSLTSTVYLRGGTYHLTTGLLLTGADNGETWSYYPPDGYNSAILDFTGVSLTSPSTSNPLGTDMWVAGPGGSREPPTTCPNAICVYILGCSNVTIDGLQIQNFPGIGIMVKGGLDPGFSWFPNANGSVGPANFVTIENNVLLNGNGGGPPFTSGDGQNANGLYSTEGPAIWGLAASTDASDTTNLHDLLIAHNVVRNMQTTGIMVQHTSGINNNVVYNYLQNLNISSDDTGAIYSQFTSGLNWSYNYIRDWRSFSAISGANYLCFPFYMDEDTSNVTAQFNVAAGAPVDTATTLIPTGFVFYGNGPGVGSNYSYNIFDMGVNASTGVGTAHYGFASTGTGAGNSFGPNALLSNFAGNPSASYSGTFCLDITFGGAAMAKSGPNLYHNYGGGSVYTAGSSNSTPVNSDSNPQIVDPKISGWNYIIDPTSPLFSAPLSVGLLLSQIIWGA